MVEGAGGAFGPGQGKTEGQDFDRERSQLHAKIGEQAVEEGEIRNLSAFWALVRRVCANLNYEFATFWTAPTLWRGPP